MTNSKSKKLLLTSVCQPFGVPYGDAFGVTHDGSFQLFWAQGIFRPFNTTTQWSIDFIAENLEIPTTNLHYPTMSRFIKEIKKGYDYIGIAFNCSTMHKMVAMTEVIRRFAPHSKIILGGYGTVLPDDEIKQYADYICREEGVGFMRRLLGEPAHNTFKQPMIVARSNLLSLPLVAKYGHILGGLGCPNGCDFCSTSHYFNRKYIPFLPDGKSFINTIMRYRELYPSMIYFHINDEDLLLNKKRAMEFLEEMRKSNLPPLSISAVSSVKALSQYSASELVEMGFDLFWIGFEGRQAGYQKMQGRPYRELVDDLRHHGISVLASVMIGFDYQTSETIREEFAELIKLRPAICQFLIYGPIVGTPFHERMKAEGRLIPEIIGNKKLYNGFSLPFKHPHISGEEMSEIQLGLYRKEFELLGPSIFRIMEDNLNGYINLRDHPSPRVRAKTRLYKKMARNALMLIPASKRYLNANVNEWLETFQKRISAEAGDITTKEIIMSKIAPILLKLTDLKIRYNIGMQPKFTRRTYRMIRKLGK